MANELTLSASIKFVKGSVSVSQGKSGVQLDVAGDDFVTKTQNVGTSEEALNLGDLSTPGYVLVRNLDTTNFVSVRSGTAAANLIKIPAGGIALFMCEAAAPFVIANTAAVKIEYTMIEA
jgi:hypothetical protein